MGPTMKDFTKQPLQKIGTIPAHSEPSGGRKQQGRLLTKEHSSAGGDRLWALARRSPRDPGAARGGTKCTGHW